MEGSPGSPLSNSVENGDTLIKSQSTHGVFYVTWLAGWRLGEISNWIATIFCSAFSLRTRPIKIHHVVEGSNTRAQKVRRTPGRINVDQDRRADHTGPRPFEFRE